MSKRIENVAGIVDPLSLDELMLAVSSAQATKAFVLLYNITRDLTLKVEKLQKDAEERSNQKPATTTRKPKEVSIED